LCVIWDLSTCLSPVVPFESSLNRLTLTCVGAADADALAAAGAGAAAAGADAAALGTVGSTTIREFHVAWQYRSETRSYLHNTLCNRHESANRATPMCIKAAQESKTNKKKVKNNTDLPAASLPLGFQATPVVWCFLT
jgi:hypothetical protein